MNKLRLIQDKRHSGPRNMGIDEAVLEGVLTGSSGPTLRLYGWEPAALTIGYFQSIEDEVDTQECKNQGIDVIRRVTGGGAVLHEFEVTYSLVSPVGFAGIPAPIQDSYEYICRGVIDGLLILGVEAQFVPLNDIIASGRKVSGNAQTRRGEVILQHGTVLIDVDVDKMFTVLKVPDEKLKDKLIQNVKKRVVGLRELVGEEVDFMQTQKALVTGFGQALQCELEREELTSDEFNRARALARDKFSTESWNWQR